MASNPEIYKSYGKQPPKGQWTTGFYECWDDPSLCCFIFFWPCTITGQIAEIVDGGRKSKYAVCYGATYRSKLRQLFSLPEEPYSDLFAHACCKVCARTLEYKELKNRGIDPSIGWEGNVEKWKREGVEPPIVPTMSR